MKRYKNGRISFNAEDISALTVPEGQPLTEGQRVFLEHVVGAYGDDDAEA